MWILGCLKLWDGLSVWEEISMDCSHVDGVDGSGFERSLNEA